MSSTSDGLPAAAQLSVAPGAARHLPAAGAGPEPDSCRAVLLFFTTGRTGPWDGGAASRGRPADGR
ncbi:hypothetical protein ACLGIH_16065 [Streptomyces sp. HMX87]|uniref:hypothetical protein n=1 Tax=Streptomyces sp. HMX87 TaxID=3390849 RepID=UPI003A8B26BD